MRFKALYTASLLVACAAASPASADPILCPPGSQMTGLTRQYEATTATGDAQCVAWGTGNIGQNTGDAFLALYPTWTLLDKTSDNPTFFDGLYLDLTAEPGRRSGEFSIHADVWTLYGEIAFGLKGGGNPKWAVWQLPYGTVEGEWEVVSNRGSLSHAVIYGSGEPRAVPEPSVLLLMGFPVGIATHRLCKRRAT